MSADTIYGVLICSIRDNVVKDNSEPGNPKKGQEVWVRILRKAEINPKIDFTTHERYPLEYMTRLAGAHCKVLSKSFPRVEDSMRYFGQCFVWFCQHVGHARILQVAGREYRDFLNGIDNLHETMRYSYRRMRSPYFLVEMEDEKGCIMQYLSQRQGFAYYVIGQLQECAEQLYGVKVSVQILTVEKLPKNECWPTNEGWRVRYRLDFDNSTYLTAKVKSRETSEDLPDVDGNTLFRLLPFSLAFDEDLVIRRVGKGLARLLGHHCRPGMLVTSVFKLRRPLIDFNWDTVMHKRNVAFELEVAVDTDDRDDNPQGEGTTPAKSSDSNTGQASSIPASCDQPSSRGLGSGRKSSVQSSPARPKSGPRGSPQASSRRGKSTGSGPGQKSGAAGQQRTSGKKKAAQRRSAGKSGRPERSSSLSLTASSVQPESKSAPGQDDKAVSISGQSSAACGHSGSVKDVHSSDHADPEPARPVIKVEPSDPESPAPKVTEHSEAGHSGSAQGRSSHQSIGASGHTEAESPERREPHKGDVKLVRQQKRCGKSRSPKTDVPARGDSPAVNAAAALLCPFAHCMVTVPKRGSDARRAEGVGTQTNPETPAWGWAAQMEGILGCPLVGLPASPVSAKPHSFRQEDLTLSRPKDTKPSEMSENRNRHGGESVTIKVTDTTSETCQPDSTELDTAKAAAIFESCAAPSQADLAKGSRKNEVTETATDSQRKERGEEEEDEEGEEKNEEEERPTVLLKGQMKYIKEWKYMVYLCTPHIGSIEELKNLKMYLSDLNMYDNSMGVVLNGFKSAPGLLHVMERERRTSCKIQKNYELQSVELATRDKFLQTILPENIVNKVLRQENTCEVFPMVTILFSNIVGFDSIVNTVNAHVVVQLVNYSLSVFDPLVEKHDLFKVETRGDAQYMVAGGVEGKEEESEEHAQRMAALALEFMSVAPLVKCPIKKTPLTLRIGIHVGNVVTGTIGTLKRQYCLFGDAVNTAARIHTSSLPGRIHLSESCHEKLQQSDFVTVFRDVLSLKGKGAMRTYWLAGRRSDPSTETNTQLFLEEQRQQAPPEPETSKEVTETAAEDNRDVADPTASEAKGAKAAKEGKSHRERQ